MLFKVPKLDHVPREEECLLHSVSYIANPSMVKILDKGVWQEGWAIQGQKRIPGGNPRLVFSGHFRAHAFTENSFLLALSGLQPLGLLMKGLPLDLSFFRSLFSGSFVPLSLLIGRLKWKRSRGNRGRWPRNDWNLSCRLPDVRLQQCWQVRCFLLNNHPFLYVNDLLITTHFNKDQLWAVNNVFDWVG